MPTESTDPREAPEFAANRHAFYIFLAAAAAFAAKLALALKTYGTNDVYTYERFGLWSRYFGADLYTIAPDLNHPPSMLHFLRFLMGLAEPTHLPFAFWLRFCGILADAGTVWLLGRIFRSRLAEKGVFACIAMIALAPTSIMISGFHGNTDPVMIFFVLAAVWLAGTEDRSLLAGVAYGLSICIKITPVILVPVLWLALPDLRRRLTLFGVAAGVVLLAWSPYWWQQPVAVVHQVFGYKSSYGLWGVSWILREVANAWPALAWLNRGYSRVGTPIVMAAIFALAIRMHTLERRPALYSQIGMVFLLFFSLTTGFAVQYMAWLTPWLAELGALPVACFLAASGVFLLVVYNYWNLGMPWYLAIAYPWSPHQYFQVVCWIVVVILAGLAWWRLRRNAPQTLELARFSGATGYAVCAAAAAAFLVYPALMHMKRDAFAATPTYGHDDVLYTQADEYQNLAGELERRGRNAEANEVRLRSATMLDQARNMSIELVRLQPARSNAKTPEEFVDASLDDYNRGDFASCVADATESLKLRPGMPAAWNNIALCNAELGQWDAAVGAAREALRLEPESDVVKQNLDWALSEQRRAASVRR